MRTTIAFRPCGTSIPYFKEGDDPAVKHEYIDLRAAPHQINELPEVALVNGLGDLLLAINGADTIFRTYGCNFSVEPFDGGAITHHAFSYVHVAFADLDRCSNRDDYYRLVGRISEALHSDETFDTDESNFLDVTFDIESLTIEGEDRGTVLSLECSVLADSEDNARNNWLVLMQKITDALVIETLEAPPQPEEHEDQAGGPAAAAQEPPAAPAAPAEGQAQHDPPQ